MKTNRIQSEAYVESEFLTTYLSVSTELIGSVHEFQFQNYSIRVSLPSLSQVRREGDEFCTATWDSWRVIDGVEVPCYYKIFRLKISVLSPSPIVIHPDMLSRPCNASGLLDPSEELTLETLCTDLDQVAFDALEHWYSVMRWATKSFMIGRDYIQGRRLSAACLRVGQGGHRVWGATTYITIEGTHHVTPDEWASAQSILENEKAVPAHITLLHDAEEYNRRRDFRRSMIDLAIAAEVYLRFAVLQTLPAALPSKIREGIEAMNINQYVSKFFPEILDATAQKEFKDLSSHLSSLFDARNKIMHMANHQRATKDECIRFVAVTKKLFNLKSMP